VTEVTREGRGDGERLAILVHDPALDEQPMLIDAVVGAARLALDNARIEEARASQARLVIAADAQRRRIQRDLHDAVQHRLLAVAMLVQRAQRVAEPSGQLLGAAAAQLGEAVRELRDLTLGIYPPALTEQGLAAAVETLAERTPVPVLVEIPPRRWPEADLEAVR
jgi:signal transduction histidine kinase